jgi:hypothetical protein
MARPLEPAFDAPPVDLDERRLHLRAHRNWTALLRGRAFPAPGEFGIEALGNLAAYAVEIDLGAEEGAMLRGIGGRLRDDAGLGADALPVDRVPAGTVLARLVIHVGSMLARRGVVRFADEFDAAGRRILCRGALLPLSADGRSIDRAVGVITWKEAATDALAASLAAEIANVRLRD